jgi:hypothetical protein
MQMIEKPFEYDRSTVAFVSCRIFSAKRLYYVIFPVLPIRTPHSAHFNSPYPHAVNNLSVLAIFYQSFNAQFYTVSYTSLSGLIRNMKPLIMKFSPLFFYPGSVRNTSRLKDYSRTLHYKFPPPEQLWFWNFIGDTILVWPEDTAFSVQWTAVCHCRQDSWRFTLHNLALFRKLNISLKRYQIVSIKGFQNIVTRPLKDLLFPSVFPGMKVALECVYRQKVATVLVTTVSYCSMHTYRAICTYGPHLEEQFGCLTVIPHTLALCLQTTNTQTFEY